MIDAVLAVGSMFTLAAGAPIAPVPDEAQILPIGGEPSWIILLSLGMIGAAMLLTTVRALRGPELPDRVIAVDLLGAFVIGVIAVVAIATNTAALIMIAIAMGLIMFLGTAAFALYMERRSSHE